MYVAVPELSVGQIREQMALAVGRVMAEGSLYDADLAALAIKQARGDLIEAIFLIRAYRTTLPRFGGSVPVDTAAMACNRRVSATFKDAPGGQVLGPTFDYTHRLLDFKLAADGGVSAAEQVAASRAPTPHIMDFLDREGLIQPEPAGGETPPDLTRAPLELPADRALRWQELGEDDMGAPAQDEEFVLYHCDNIQATGFLEHIKLPHCVDFQSELELFRKLRRDAQAAAPEESEGASGGSFSAKMKQEAVL